MTGVRRTVTTCDSSVLGVLKTSTILASPLTVPLATPSLMDPLATKKAKRLCFEFESSKGYNTKNPRVIETLSSTLSRSVLLSYTIPTSLARRHLILIPTAKCCRY